MGTILLLDAVNLCRHALDRRIIGHWTKASGRVWIALVGMEQTVGMAVLQIAFDTLGTEFALIERKLHPRLYTNNLVVLDFKLDTTLLTTETAVGLDELVWLDACI